MAFMMTLPKTIYFKQFKKRALFNAGAARLMHCKQKRQLAKLM